MFSVFIVLKKRTHFTNGVNLPLDVSPNPLEINYLVLRVKSLQ